MVNQLEAELRDALAERAQEVPPSAGTRLRQRDYRPRTGRVRPRFAIGALAASAGTAGVAVAIVGPGASNAFAGWASAPTAAPETQISVARAACDAQVAGGPAGSRFSQPVLSDTRGPFTVLIFQAGGASTSCITGPDFTAVTTSAGGSASGKVTAAYGAAGPTTGRTGPAVMAFGAPDAGPARPGTVQLAGTQLKTPGGQPYALAEGRAGAGVTAVTLLLSDGTRVIATTSHGWFAAWWPGSKDATAAEITTAGHATTTQAITQPPAVAPPSTATGPSGASCTAGPGGVTCHAGGRGEAPTLGAAGPAAAVTSTSGPAARAPRIAKPGTGG
jgi:hypothetical protein